MKNGSNGSARMIKVCACGAPWEHKDLRRGDVPQRPSAMTYLEQVAGFDGRSQSVPIPCGPAFQGPANPDFCPTPKVIVLRQ